MSMPLSSGLEWRDFAEFSVSQLYEVLQFRQGIFVVEQVSPYADLDGRDQHAHHLLLHNDGALAGYDQYYCWVRLNSRIACPYSS